MSRDTAQIEPFEHPDGRDGLLLRTPYHPGFVAEIKGIPYRNRTWMAEADGWWVAAESQDIAFHLVLRYFRGFERLDRDTGEVEYVDKSGASARQGGLGL